MQGHTDEVEFLKYFELSQEDPMVDDGIKDPWLKVLKTRLFAVFFRLNTLKFSMSVHYYMVLVAIEFFHVMTLVLLDGSYSTDGPYDSDSPWNLSQTQWLIDLCWVFRVDRYFRTSLAGFIVLVCIWGTLLSATIALGVALGWYQQVTPLSKFAVKGLKVLITLVTSLLFIPMMDTWAFAMKCSVSGGSQCLSLQEGYQYMIIYLAAAAVHLGLVLLCSGLYYECCMICGGTMAKPHARFKLMQKLGLTIVIFTYHFATSTGKVIIYLSFSFAVGLILCYFYAQYIPYFNLRMCKLKMSVIVAFTSAVFCMFIGEFFKSTDQTNSSVTMLFYFLTPCLIQITQLAMSKRCKLVAEKKIQQLTNIYQVELKARWLVNELEAARSRSVKSHYGEIDENNNEEFKEFQNQSQAALADLYIEAMRKFPTSELLYLWSGLLQLHVFGNYVFAMIQCFKGLSIANKLDSQCLLFQFRRTAQGYCKSTMRDDAYDYVMFERSFGTAQKNDEAVMRAQFFFWLELESKAPKLQKLTKLAGETTAMITKAKANYQGLLKLNSKNSNALRMFGGFLSSLSNFTETGQRYIQKADAQDEAKAKNVNANVLNALTQPLSFFDNENAIISVSADFETVGEIEKVNVAACSLLVYLQAELVGRNIALVIPPPYSDNHDAYMRKFHDSGAHWAVDVQNLMMYFLTKNGNLVECRTLIKVVPNGTLIPFLMAVLKPTKPKYKVVQISPENCITGTSIGCDEFLTLNLNKGTSEAISEVITNFEEVKEDLMTEEGAILLPDSHGVKIPTRGRLVAYAIGSVKSFLLKLEHLKEETNGTTADREFATAPETPVRPLNVVSTILKAGYPQEVSLKASITSPLPIKSAQFQATESDSSSEEDSNEDEGEEGSSESSSESETESVASATGVQPVLPGFVGNEGSLPATGNEGKPLLDRSLSATSSDQAASRESVHKASTSQKSADLSSERSEESYSGKSEEPAPAEADQHSVYSSSKSVNSSMASLAQFNKSIKALVLYEFERTNKYVLRFKYTLLLTILVLIIMSILTFKVIDSSASFNMQLSNYVNKVGDLRLYTQSLSYYARVISLLDSGAIPPNATERSAMFAWMQSDTTNMHAINLEIYKNLDVLSAGDKAVYSTDDIPVWFLEGGQVNGQKTNLLDATTNVILQGFLTGKELANTTLTLSNRRAFYLFRNGHGESLSVLNRSAGFYVNAALRDIARQRLTAIMLVMTSVLLLLFCAGFAVIPAMRVLEKSKVEVWDIFFEIPDYVCRIMKGKCNDRLQILNESVNVDLEEREEEQVHEDEKEAETTKALSKGKKEEKSAKKREKEVKKTQVIDIRQRNVIIGKIFAFFVISFVYFYLVYYTGFDSIESMLEQEPVAINWASRRRHLSRSVNAWVLESLLQNTTNSGYKYVVPKGQSISDPISYATSQISELEYVENSLIFGNSEAGLTFSSMRSSGHDALLFDDACTAPVVRSGSDCGSVGNKVMQQGLHSALAMYLTLARTQLLKIQNWASTGNLTAGNVQVLYNSEDMRLLRDMDSRYLYDPLTYSSDLYETDYADHQANMAVYKNLLIILYTFFAIIIFFAVYSPMINRIGREVKDAWSMCALVPQEFQEEFRRLNAAIKDRRDNFKYR